MADFLITRNSFPWLGLALIAGMLGSPAFGDTIQVISGTGEGDPFAGAITFQVDKTTDEFTGEYINTTGETILDLHFQINPAGPVGLMTPFFSTINTNGGDIDAYAGTDPGIAENQVFQIIFTGSYAPSITVTPSFIGVPEPAPEPSPIVLGGFALILFLSMKRRSCGVSVRITSPH
jgi:hypothetical protein